MNFECIGMILAAGLGTRLKPVSEFCPKPLIPVAGLEPLFFAIHQFYKLGIRKLMINTHHLNGQVNAAVDQWKSKFPGMEFRMVHEDQEILGTGGGIIHALLKNRDWCSDRPLLVQNGDTLTGISLSKLLGDGTQSRFAVSPHSEFLKTYASLWLFHDGSWAGRGSDLPTKGLRPAHFLGAHYLCRSTIQVLMNSGAEAIPSDLFGSIYAFCTNRGQRFFGVDFLENGINQDEFWFDVGTPQTLLAAQKNILDRLESCQPWQQALQLRYPNLLRIQEGLWTNQQSASSQMKIPSIVVLSQKEFLKTNVEIGPYAVLLNEYDGVKNLGDLRQASHCVIFSHPSGNRILPSVVQDAMELI